MMTRRRQVHAVAAVLVLALLSTGASCNRHLPPQSQVAVYGGRVAEALVEVQRTIITLDQTHVISEETTARILNTFQRVSALGIQLSEALTLYDMAATIVERQRLAFDIRALLRDLDSLLIELPLPARVEEAARQIVDTLKNVLALTAQIRSVLPPPIQ